LLAEETIAGTLHLLPLLAPAMAVSYVGILVSDLQHLTIRLLLFLLFLVNQMARVNPNRH
jgi:hypothetical protein